MRDILQRLYRLQSCNENTVPNMASKKLQPGSDGFDESIVWQRTLDQTNSIFFQLPAETQALSKQVSIVMLSVASLPSNVHQAALTNFEFQIENDHEILASLIQDLIEAFTESISCLADQGINVVKNNTKDKGSYLKKKSLFRSNTQIHYFTHCFLHLG